MNERLYRAARTILGPLFRLMFRLEVSGAEHIPSYGPVILCCNHISMLDPIMVAAGVRNRCIHFMAKAELFKLKLFGKVLNQVGVIAVKRGESDMSSLRISLTTLKNEEVLGIFAQGHRDKTNELAMETGVGLLALRSGAPVLPLMLIGNYRLFHRLLIVVGPAVDLTKYAGKYDSGKLRDATADIERAARALLPKASH